MSIEKVDNINILILQLHGELYKRQYNWRMEFLYNISNEVKIFMKTNIFVFLPFSKLALLCMRMFLFTFTLLIDLDLIYVLAMYVF